VTGELPGEPERVAVPREEVVVEGEDDARRLEVGPDVERAAEGDAGPLGGVLGGDRRPGVEAGLREAGLEAAPQVGLRRRGVRREQEGEAGASVGVVRQGELVHLGEEAPEGDRLPLHRDALRALGVVQVEERALVPGGGSAQAGGVGRISLDLHRAPFGRRDEETRRVAVEGDGGRVVEALSGAVLRRLAHVRHDLLARRLAGGEPAQRRRRAEDLQERAARHLGRGLGGAGLELAAGGGGPGLELLDALPERAVPRRPGRCVILDDRERFHRWHVVQLTREWTS
jgi:hypothetical protein